MDAHGIKELLAFRLLRRGDLKVLSSRVLIAGITCHTRFQQMTMSKRHPKEGVG